MGNTVCYLEPTNNPELTYHHKVLTGRQFNYVFGRYTFVKLTNHREVHNNFGFQTGLNKDYRKFKSRGECSEGGIYFCNINELYKWLDYNGEVMHYCRLVTIPDDARVYIESGKFKTDKLILGERYPISEC